MRTIVTGGAGFIGSHIVEALLARGDEVHIVDDLSSGKLENVPDGATLHVHDVRESLEALAQETQAQAFLHLAAQVDVRVSVAEPKLDAEINVLGTVNVLEAARLTGARVVFASTGGAIYGECARPAREDDPCLPLSPYGRPSSRPRATSAPTHASLGRRTSLSASATSTARARIPTGRPAWWRSSSAGCARASRAGSSATARRAATTSTSATLHER